MRSAITTVLSLTTLFSVSAPPSPNSSCKSTAFGLRNCNGSPTGSRHGAKDQAKEWGQRNRILVDPIRHSFAPIPLRNSVESFVQYSTA